MDSLEKIKKAAALIHAAPTQGLAYTGAGISVESGIPPFRGRDGLWNTVDPSFIEINHFYADPEHSWAKIRKIFYDNWGKAKPNAAHFALAEMMNAGFLQGIVTQNIDMLHQHAGAKHVIEFHGTLEALVCLKCAGRFAPERELIDRKRPSCPKCGGLLKPDFVFFGEGIPRDAFDESFRLAENCKWILVVGTTGEVMPACQVPMTAKRAGAKIIEINLQESAYTNRITDLFLPGKAVAIMEQLLKQTVSR